MTNFEQLLRFFTYGRPKGRAGPYRIEYLGWGNTVIVDDDDVVYLFRDSGENGGIVYFKHSAESGKPGKGVMNAMWSDADYECEGHFEMGQVETVGGISHFVDGDYETEVLD